MKSIRVITHNKQQDKSVFLSLLSKMDGEIGL